jgi:tetratricopeptide (TPR) repeat protein
MHETLMQMGHYHMRLDAPDEASVYYARAIDAKPYDAQGRKAMGVALAQMGDWQASVEQHRWCLRIEPGSHDAAVALAWMLSTVPDDAVRDGEQAVQLAQAACRQTGFRNAEYMDVLAAAYAEVGRFDEAQAMAQRVLVSATSGRTPAIAERVERRLAGYRNGRPWREPLEQ